MTTLTHDQPKTDRPSTFSALIDAASATAVPAWLAERRRRAAVRFHELGLPTRRDEEWRLTNLAPLSKLALRPGLAAAAQVTDADVASTMIAGCDGPRLVFVNGRLAPSLSAWDALPEGLTVTTFNEADGAAAALLEQHLGAYATDDEAFTALNTACLEDGTLITVARGTRIERPLLILHLTVASEPTATHPRTLIVTEPDCHVTVVEEYAAVGGGTYLTNAVTEVSVGARADVHHYLLERESAEAFNISTLCVHQETESDFSSHSALLGGRVVRNNVYPVLDGERCESLLNGLYLGRDEQHLDNHMRVEHASPNCHSRQHYKGILNGESHGVFSGRIIVRQIAQKTDAIQHNASLLLSESARAHAKPQLEIYADDVRCTHGATIGELEDEAVFYLRSRGLDESAARSLLIHAFASEGLDRMELEPIRAALETELLDRLPGRAALQLLLHE